MKPGASAPPGAASRSLALGRVGIAGPRRGRGPSPRDGAARGPGSGRDGPARPPVHLILPLLVAASLAACGRGGEEWADVVVRDSAGVAVVENAAGTRAWGEGEGLRLSERPLMDLGSATGESGDAFHRVTDAVRLSDGRIVVANAGSGELWYFDATGERETVAGGLGEGPGEFAAGVLGAGLTSIERLPGDTVVAFDQTHRRLSTFDPGGAFVGSTSLDAPPASISPRVAAAGWPGPGVFVGHSTRTPDRSVVSPGSRVRRFTEVLLFYGRTGAVRDTAGRYPGDQIYASFSPRRASGEFDVQVLDIPFLEEFVVDARSGRVAVGSTGAYEVHVYDSTGTLRQVVRKDSDPRPVSREIVDAWIRESLASLEDPGRRSRRRAELREVPLPDTLPRFRKFQLDTAGRLWIGEFVPPGEDGPVAWEVYGRSGRRLGSVDVPSGFEPLEIGERHALGLWTGPMGVEHVRLYGLRTTGEPPSPE